MPLFAAGRVALCATAQIMGGGSSAGEGKLKVTPGWRARRDADRYGFGSTSEGAVTEGAPEGRTQHRPPPHTHTQPHPLPINLLYPGLNMSRADVTLRLCGGQAEREWGPVEVKCSGVCRPGDMRRRKKEVCVLGGKLGGGGAKKMIPRGESSTPGQGLAWCHMWGLSRDTHGTKAELSQIVLFLPSNIP